MPAGLAKLLTDVPGFLTAKEFHFLSPDGSWNIGLTREFIALSTKAYTRWEEFQKRLVAVTDSLVKLYEPSFFNRVGLRYRNVIVQSRLGLSGRSWTRLLKPHVLGELSCEDVAPHIKQAARDIVISLGDQGHVRIRHGLGKVKKTEELGYIIDIDFYCEGKVDVRETIALLDYFHRQAGNLFRWCITPELHDRLKPTAV